MFNDKQIATIIQIVKQVVKQEDVHGVNIVGDKTIYAKEGLYVGNFNPNYDLYVHGRGCIEGDLLIKGNLFYENNGVSVDQNYMDVKIKQNRANGFRVRDDIGAKGILWDSQEEEFIIGQDAYLEGGELRLAKNLCNLRLKNINFNNAYCKNILLDSCIIGTQNRITIEGELILQGNLKIKGQIGAIGELLEIKSQIVSKTIRVEGSLFVDSVAEISKHLTCYELKTNNIECEDISANNMRMEGEMDMKQSCNIGGYLNVNKSADFKNGVEIKGSLYLGNNLIFTGDNTGIAFAKLSTIENASVDYIAGKKVSQLGDIVTTECQQELSNKSLGTNLDAKYFRIKNVDHPVDAYDVANKKYVDNFVVGGHMLKPVKITTNKKLAAIFMASSYQLIGENMEKLIVDEIETDVGDRILVKNQNNKMENGVYIVVANGNKNQQWILQLAEDWSDIVKNRPKVTPMIMCRYGAINGKKLFGINVVYSDIWEIMETEQFVKQSWSIYEQLIAEIKEIKNELKNWKDNKVQ